MRRTTLALALALAVTAGLATGCGGHKPAGGTDPGGRGDAFDSYPQLALIPADTPYAFVAFKRMPAALAHKIYTGIGPWWSQKLTAVGDGSPLAPARDAVLSELKGDPAAIGLTETPRLSLYGIDGYPVFRFEIASGKRLLAAVERVAAKVGAQLPAAQRDGDRSVWTFDYAKASFLIALGETEIVVAGAPRGSLAQRRALILGDVKPDAAISPSVFRELAERNGFTGQGVGFLDVRNMIGRFVDPAAVSAGCGPAIDAVAGAFPRLVVGYDIGGNQLDYKLIVEIAAPVLDALREVTTSIPRVERSGPRPIMSMSAAFDADAVRALLPRAADAMRLVSGPCTNASELAQSLDGLAARWPAYLRGVRGVSVAVTAFDAKSNMMEGSAAVHLADPVALFGALTARIGLPNLQLAPDGRAVPILPGMLPFELHAAMSAHGLAIGIGADGAAEAEAALGGTPEPAPLFRATVDYTHMDKFADEGDDDLATMRALAELFGEGVAEISMGDRGIVGEFSIELQP